MEKANVAMVQTNRNYKCPICNKSITDFTEKLEVQEKVPVIHGGTRKYNNLQLVHRYCNKQYYKIFPLKGELPTKQQKQKGYKIIRQLRLAEIL